MLTEYMKHIHKGKQQVEIDVYMWNDLSDEFKSDFRNKYRNHCEAAKQVDVVYRKAIKHLDTYSKVPEDLEFETMLAQDMLVLMYISLLPIYTNGQQASSNSKKDVHHHLLFYLMNLIQLAIVLNSDSQNVS